MKPVALFARAIRMGCRLGGIVLDPFCGSGTTVLAAEQQGRRARVLEVEPHYCDIILQRWEDATGGTAERLVEGADA